MENANPRNSSAARIQATATSLPEKRGGIQVSSFITTSSAGMILTRRRRSPKREEIFANVATNITTFVHPSDPNRVALSMDVADMDAFDAVLKSDAGAAAMKYDGVRPETVVVFVEG